MCLDYRWLNKVTKKNKYPLPLPEELMDRLAGAQVFSKLDLRSGYWQMPVREQDVEKTAFKCHYGQFEFLVCPFSVTNAPPQFQAMVNDLFADMIDKFLVVFLDDLIVYSQNMAEHRLPTRWEIGDLFLLPEHLLEDLLQKLGCTRQVS